MPCSSSTDCWSVGSLTIPTPSVPSPRRRQIPAGLISSRRSELWVRRPPGGKGIFIPGPDHRELQCIPLVQDSIDAHQLPWIRSDPPASEALCLSTIPETHSGRVTEHISRYSSTMSSDPALYYPRHRDPYFFRLHEFLMVPPSSATLTILGMVLSRSTLIQTGKSAASGRHSRISVKQSRFHPPSAGFEIHGEEHLKAEACTNISTVMRFSHSPGSRETQWFLVNAVCGFLPAHPAEGITSLSVSKLTSEDEDWIRDRITTFSNHDSYPHTARRRIRKLFSVACAALSATNFQTDDKRTHRLVATVPSIEAYPISLSIRTSRMSEENGCSHQRPAHAWIAGSRTVSRVTIARSEFAYEFAFEFHATPLTHPAIVRAIDQHGVIEGRVRTADICIILDRTPTAKDPVFEVLAEERLFDNLNSSHACHANAVFEWLYGSTPRSRPSPTLSDEAHPMSLGLDGTRIHLCNDQCHAMNMGLESHSILAVQAAYDSGKTVIGTYLAAQLVGRQNLVIVTETTNVACAQFTDTLLRLDDFNHLRILRFVSDSALMDGTPVDLHSVLQSLIERYGDRLEAKEVDRCQVYIDGRRLLETLMFNPDSCLHLTNEEGEEYRIAE